MKSFALIAGLLAAGAAASHEVYGMYYDQWHTANLPNYTVTNGITHLFLSGINPSQLITNPIGNFTPFVSVPLMKKKFGGKTKVLISVGGWSWSTPFANAVANSTSRALFAKNCATMLNETGADGLDLDWEFPGGNGDNYKQISNSAKVSEITTFPLLLEAIRGAIGKHKLLTIATPGKKADMIAFTAETIPKIAKHVDFFNIMAYNLINRRGNVTKHHTGVADSLEAIDTYLCYGLPPNKAVLGFVFYALWFTTNPKSNCATHPIGCEIVPAEDAYGKDTGKSGALTFEPSNMAPAPVPTNLTLSPDGSCGAKVGHKCGPGYCCSQYGYCGSSDTYCGSSCLGGYGVCNSVSITTLWQKALKNGIADEVGGGQYYWDSAANIFWTWDSPHFIKQKFERIVKARKLRGVMSWSLGEDTYDNSHILAIQDGIKGCS